MNSDDDLTEEKAKVIKAVDRETVHRICSGQVRNKLNDILGEEIKNLFLGCFNFVDRCQRIGGK